MASGTLLISLARKEPGDVSGISGKEEYVLLFAHCLRPLCCPHTDREKKEKETCNVILSNL